MTAPRSTGQIAVLRDYPVRLWAMQQEYIQGVLREFELLLSGEASGVLSNQPPGQLLKLAEMFTTSFGPLLAAISEERQEALDQGLDRIDSHVPLVEGTPELLEQVGLVLDSVDAYCRAGSLLTLPREPWMVQLADWTRDELVRQHDGDKPEAWPGPFSVAF